jgi:hypothetical protein
MKTYIYYNMHDSSEEPQGTLTATNYEEACLIAPKLKNMDYNIFHDLFIVQQSRYKKNGTKKL